MFSQVGVIFGQALVKMAGEGFDVKNFHLIGHSLGCHVHGIAGRTAKAQNIIISRITGLDCAGPAFFPLNPFLIPLNAMDANFVDIIYTNSELLGGRIYLESDGDSNVVLFQQPCQLDTPTFSQTEEALNQAVHRLTTQTN